jgi:hypothetical protein
MQADVQADAAPSTLHLETAVFKPSCAARMQSHIAAPEPRAENHDIINLSHGL